MGKRIYRYTFNAEVPMADLEASLLLAIMSAESLHGESQVRLEASHYLDPDARVCIIDASTPVGHDVNRLFVGFLQREFGADGFSVECVDRPPRCPDEADQPSV
jgi:hypothetical protein